jgi:hypothetical protein
MLHRRPRLVVILGIAAFGALAVSPVLASDPVKPKNGGYMATCPQGAFTQCGEAYWNVKRDGTRIPKDAGVPWPNDPDNPSIGICGRYNPITTDKIRIKDGHFTYHGTAKGHDYTWKGKWVKRGRVKGTVDWDGCSTVANYVGHLQ